MFWLFCLLSGSTETTLPDSMEGSMAVKIHTHCGQCRQMNCMITPDDVASCAMSFCVNNCGCRFHSCKSIDHKKVCQKEKVSCINKFYGCPVELARDRIPEHLPICPASVIQCSREWNRWPMHSSDKGWKAPMPYKNPHVKCGQLDVALAMRDQRMLMDSFKTPMRTRKILRNPLNQHYPAVPINIPSTGSVDMEGSTSDASLFSDDDTGTPWDLNQSAPGLQQAVCSHLYGASKQATESLTKALDYVTGKQGLQRLSEAAKQQREVQMNEKLAMKYGEKPIDSSVDQLSEMAITDTRTSYYANSGAHSMDTSDLNRNISCNQESTNNEDDDLDIYINEKKLYEVLGVHPCLNFMSSYYVKPMKMFTFMCGQEFRRDEYAWHVQNSHCDIQCNLDGWFEQRCPLNYAGCSFSFQRFRPKNPKGFITHSPILQSFGMRNEEELEQIGDMSGSNNSVQDDDIRTEMGRKRLREATPEIHTSYKCESTVQVIPRYKSVSREVSPCPPLTSILERQKSEDCVITRLPFEILQKIALHLDGFSLNNLSMTCHLLQNVCCSLLDQKGVVSLVWEKTTAQRSANETSKDSDFDRDPRAGLSDVIKPQTWSIAYKVCLLVFVWPSGIGLDKQTF